MKRWLSILIIVCVLLTTSSLMAEESISPKDKAIELAKKSVYLSYDDGTRVTAQEYAELNIKGDYIFPIGWEAVDVSETMYCVVFKFLPEGYGGRKDREAAWYFHVVPKDNIAQHISQIFEIKDNGDDNTGEIVVTSQFMEYLKRIKKTSTYTVEKISAKLYKLLGRSLYEEDKIDSFLGTSKGER